MCSVISRERTGCPRVLVIVWTPDACFVCCGRALTRDSVPAHVSYGNCTEPSGDRLRAPARRLPDHLIRQHQERRGKCDPERLRRLEIDGQFELHGLLDRELGRLSSLEELVHIGGRTPK